MLKLYKRSSTSQAPVIAQTMARECRDPKPNATVSAPAQSRSSDEAIYQPLAPECQSLAARAALVYYKIIFSRNMPFR